MTIKEYYAERIIDFLKKHASYVFDRAPKAIIRKHILAHIEYQTIVCIWNQGEIVGVCAFNVNGNKAEIVDCVVNPNYRNSGLLKKMTLIAMQRYPFLETLSFKRISVNDDDPHSIDLRRWLGNRKEIVLSHQGVN